MDWDRRWRRSSVLLSRDRAVLAVTRKRQVDETLHMEFAYEFFMIMNKNSLLLLFDVSSVIRMF